METIPEKGVINTDRELYREDNHDPLDPNNSYGAVLFVMQNGNIGINVNGWVIAMPIRTWHSMGLVFEQLSRINWVRDNPVDYRG